MTKMKEARRDESFLESPSAAHEWTQSIVCGPNFFIKFSVEMNSSQIIFEPGVYSEVLGLSLDDEFLDRRSFQRGWPESVIVASSTGCADGQI